MPFAIASVGWLMVTSCPSSRTDPLVFGNSPKMTFANSVRPGPNDPSKSHYLTSIDMKTHVAMQSLFKPSTRKTSWSVTDGDA